MAVIKDAKFHWLKKPDILTIPVVLIQQSAFSRPHKKNKAAKLLLRS